MIKFFNYFFPTAQKENETRQITRDIQNPKIPPTSQRNFWASHIPEPLVASATILLQFNFLYLIQKQTIFWIFSYIIALTY